jgi:hypothetical protein
LSDLLNIEEEENIKNFEFCHDPELYQSAPQPENFETFEEYEESLLNWSREVDKKLGVLQLPQILGKNYYRPYVNSTIGTKEIEIKEELKEENDLTGLIDNKLDIDETWESL